jgi:hypothetical protein
MAQSALTVTTPNPTPPTNFGNTGATPPNPPNYTKLTYADWQDNTKFDTTPPPYYDDGAAGAGATFTANVAALASGSADTAGGTGNPTGSTAGTPGTWPGVANGTVPASTSVAHEGAGTETLFTQTYSSAILAPVVLTTVGCGPNLVKATTDAGAPVSPNTTHASTMSPVTNPALVSIAPTTLASAPTGTQLITATGTNFVPGCRIWHDGVEQSTTFVSATSLTATVKKRPFAGIAPVVVKLGGLQMGVSAPFTWT